MTAAPASRVLSIVIPAYNEERFIGTLLEANRAVDLEPLGVRKEIIVVDDHSADRHIARSRRRSQVVVLRRLEKTPARAGGARRHRARDRGSADHPGCGPRVDPQDYRADARGAAPGARRHRLRQPLHAGGRHANQSLAAYLGGRSLSIVARVFTGAWITDTVTALKLFPRQVIKELRADHERVRTRSRNHRQDAGAALPHRRGAGHATTREARKKGRRSDCATGSSGRGPSSGSGTADRV